MSREDLDVASFLSSLAEHKVIFVYFWASWCAPCKQFSKVYEQVSVQFPGITFIKVNIEQQKVLADYFGILSIPYLLVFNQELVVYAQAGSMSEVALQEIAQQALEKPQLTA